MRAFNHKLFAFMLAALMLFTALPVSAVTSVRAEIRRRSEDDSRSDLRFIFSVSFNDSHIEYRGKAYGKQAGPYEITRFWSVLTANGSSAAVNGVNIFTMYEDADGAANANVFTYTAVLVGVKENHYDAVIAAVPYLTYLADGESFTVQGGAVESSVNGAMN